MVLTLAKILLERILESLPKIDSIYITVHCPDLLLPSLFLVTVNTNCYPHEKRGEMRAFPLVFSIPIDACMNKNCHINKANIVFVVETIMDFPNLMSSV